MMHPRNSPPSTPSKGLFQYTRLPFELSSAPAVSQRVMVGLPQGIPNVSVYLDDILIAGKMEQDHLEILEKILSRLQNVGIWLKYSKCFHALLNRLPGTSNFCRWIAANQRNGETYI